MPPTKPEKEGRPKEGRTKERRREGDKDKDKAKTHKLSLKGSARLVAEFVRTSIQFPISSGTGEPGFVTGFADIWGSSSNTRYTRSCGFSMLDQAREDGVADGSRFQRGVYPAEDFTAYVPPSPSFSSPSQSR